MDNIAKKKRKRTAHYWRRGKKRTPRKSQGSSITSSSDDIICIDSCSSVDQLHDVVSISDTTMTSDVLDTSFSSPPKLEKTKKIFMKEARIILTDIMLSNAIRTIKKETPKEDISQDNFNDSEDSSLEIIPYDRHDQERVATISISSATTSSSILFVCDDVAETNNVNNTQTVSSVSANKACKIEKPLKTSDKKSKVINNIKKSRDSLKGKGRKNSVSKVLNFDNLDDKNNLKKCKNPKSLKRKRKNSVDDNIVKSAKCADSCKDVLSAVKGPKKTINYIVNVETEKTESKTIVNTPKKRSYVKKSKNTSAKETIQRRASSGSSKKSSKITRLVNGEFLKSPSIPDCTTNDPRFNNSDRTSNLTFNSNDEPPILSPQNLEYMNIQTKYPPSTTINIASGTEETLGLDEKDCCLDSIAAAIENDLALGNRLSPVGDCLDNMVIAGVLPIHSCCLNKTANDDSELLDQVDKNPTDITDISSENRTILSNRRPSGAAGTFDCQRNRPSIVEDDILPKGSFTFETKLSNDNITERINVSTIENNVKLSNAICITTKCPEISALLDDNNANIASSSKSNGVVGYEDALNNNQEINYVNKNSLDSEKQEDKITLYSTGSAGSLDFATEFNALRGILDDDKQYGTIDDCLVLDHDEHDIDEDELNLNKENEDELNLNKENEEEIEKNELNKVEIEKNKLNEDAIEKDKRDKNEISDNKPDEIDEAIDMYTVLVLSKASAKENNKSYDLPTLEKPSVIVSPNKTEKKPGDRKKICKISSQRVSDAGSSRETEDSIERDSGNESQRKRKWISNDSVESPIPAKQTIRLRRNWNTDSIKTLDESSNITSSAKTEDFGQGNDSQATKNDAAPKIISVPTNKRPKEQNDNETTVDKSAEDDDSSDSSSSGSGSSSSGSSSSTSSNTSNDAPPIENSHEPQEPQEEIDAFGAEQKEPDDDEDDCISLYPESLGMDRLESPPRSQFPARRSPLYKRMKSDNIDRFLNANKQECDAVIEEHRINMKNNIDERNKGIKRRISKAHSPIKAPSSEINGTNQTQIASGSQISRTNQIQSALGPQISRTNQIQSALGPQISRTNQIQNSSVPQISRTNQTQNSLVPQISRTNQTAPGPAGQNSRKNSTENGPVTQVNRTNQVEKCSAPQISQATLAIPNIMNDDLTVQKMYSLFRGVCYSWIKNGTCLNGVCKFAHALKPALQKIEYLTVKNKGIIVEYAIEKNYRFFIELVHEKLLKNFNMEQILRYYCRFCHSQFLTQTIIVNTIKALTVLRLSLKEIIEYLNRPIVEADVETPFMILSIVFQICTIEPGYCWETLGILISKTIPPHWLIEQILSECVHNRKSKEHIDSVNENVLKRIPTNTLLSLNADLLKAFHHLRIINDPIDDKNVNNVETHFEPEERGSSPMEIASPDSPQATIYPPVSEKLTGDDSSTHAMSATSNFDPNDEFEYVVDVTALTSDFSRQRTPTDDEFSPYSVLPIDNVPSAQSAYKGVLWKFHWDLQGIRDGLEHKDYNHVKRILEENIANPDRLPHMKGFYNILIKEISSAKHHLAALIHLTVQPGASEELRQFMFDLAVYVLVKLADVGMWVHAYELLEYLRIYGNNNNTCAFTLLSAEINIANYRPIKAFELLRRSQILFTNTKVWKYHWCSDDKLLRVIVIDALLFSLCNGYAQQALSLLEFIIGDQTNFYRPINLSRHVDRIARVLLLENRTESILAFGNLILQTLFPVKKETFKALIIHIFHNDLSLAKRLYSYASWHGVYSRAKIGPATHQIVHSDLSEEELYLMFSALISNLATSIGHALDRLGPRKLFVVLVMETIPTEKQLCLDRSDDPSVVGAANKKRRLILQKILESFQPKIKIVRRSFGKICKIQSTSLVNHLKSGNFDQ